MHFHPNLIPKELLEIENHPDDVSILVGQNGSGKSTLLHELSKYHLRHGKKVIAIANSIHDKFESRHRNFKSLRGRSGRSLTRTTIKKALETIGRNNDEIRLKAATRTLHYVGFEPMIGFRLEKFRPHNLDFSEDNELLPNGLDRLQFLLQRSLQETRNPEDIIWLNTENFDYYTLDKINLTELFVWESYMKSKKIISKIEVYLRKGNQILSLLKASSGELALITSIVYLSTIIDSNTVILIDEPENSLHPVWQKEYVNTILNIFYLYQPKIVIATHSPLIVNGAELNSDSVKVFKSENFTFTLQIKEPLNIEELYYRFFDLTTPENRFLSNRLIRLLNLLTERKIKLIEFNREVDKIKQMTYQIEQTEALSAVQSLASQIAEENS